MRNVILLTKKAKHKWFELGLALKIPIHILEELDTKHDGSPLKALIRVYRYWLANKNVLQPTWEKLIAALQVAKLYSISANVTSNVMVCKCCYYVAMHFEIYSTDSHNHI